MQLTSPPAARRASGLLDGREPAEERRAAAAELHGDGDQRLGAGRGAVRSPRSPRCALFRIVNPFAWQHKHMAAQNGSR